MAVMRVSFRSEALDRSVDLNVIVPMETAGIPGEVKALKPRVFQTLYLLNGYSGNQDDWLTFSDIRRLSDQYDLAVVMPSGENRFYVDGNARGMKWGELAGKEIVEFTRSMFPLSDKRADTFIGGLSMGGFGALRLGACYCHTFSKIITLSGAFITDNIAGKREGYADEVGDYAYYHHVFGDLDRVKDSPKDPFWCAAQAVKSKCMPGVYMACGTEDFLIGENRAAKKKLEKMGVSPVYLESPGSHDWGFWNSYLEPAIQWLLEFSS